MNQGVRLLVFPVRDVARAKALYSTLLGTEPYADSPYYVGFKVGDQEIGLDPNVRSRLDPRRQELARADPLRRPPRAMNQG